MEIRQLRYFVEIADRGNITKAADHLHVAQSALSYQLAKLEAELKADLLHRQSRGVVLTEVGTVLLPYARAILKQFDGLPQVVASGNGKLSGKVTLGMSPSVCSFLSVPLLQHVREKHADIRLELTEELTGTLEADLRKGAMDLAVLIDHQALQGLLVTPLVREELKVITKANGTASRVRYSSTDALSLPLLLPKEGQGIRPLLDAMALSQALPRIEPFAEINSVTILRSMILAGVGATILTEMAFEHDLENGSLQATGLSPPLYRDLCLCRHTELPPTLASEAIATAVAEVCVDLLLSKAWHGAEPFHSGA
ncbi:LysR family transcriptional regulator [Tianweitania sediminis]|uniref:LysR family transcriptional regulator n=1 Tax=Tianweitania sediminis TaxID=1502156 RepID=A0A8J7UM57_9HYPH|nr:LysR substrate-binding domain-containing protein [Tianweitania sediminis]MBP0441464.1 LysR family transcriptional regulator [Tianweitania sediminis]